MFEELVTSDHVIDGCVGYEVVGYSIYFSRSWFTRRIYNFTCMNVIFTCQGATRNKKRWWRMRCARTDQSDHDVIERTGDAEAEGSGIFAKEAF